MTNLRDNKVTGINLLVDLGVLCTLGLALLLIFLFLNPTKRGFYCDDESIRYPHNDSTIPTWSLYIYCFLIPALTICITELGTSRGVLGKRVKFMSCHAPIWLTGWYRSIVDFLLGAAASQLLTDIGKYTIGRLRPHFLAVCSPMMSLNNCTAYGNGYIETYVCQGDADDVSEARLSFPSGHASFSAYTMIYTAIYIQIRWLADGKRVEFRLAKVAVQLALILITYYTALSRVMDHHHHWSDVLAGGVIGVTVAIVNARYASKLNLPMDEGDIGENIPLR